MRWLLLSLLSIVFIACNKGSDRKFRLVKIRHEGFGFPTIFEYDAQGLLSLRYVDFKGTPDAGGGVQFKYENSRLTEIVNSHVSYAGLTQTVDKIEYDGDGRLESMQEELIEGRPDFLTRRKFGYIGSDAYFDSCTEFRTRQGTETPYLLYTFTRDSVGNILSQSTWSPDQDNWVLNYKEEFSYGSVDNPEYKLGNPVSFLNYYSKKICTKVVRYNFEGTVLDQRGLKAIMLSPILIIVKEDNMDNIYYDLK
ncbi:hypothetical protein [Pseudoflavitalea rhizosphaerae]|uniref:hypothetical protein n=1 Tax=Pseudoflavitalea rhizosphaerae TaxID=1884793 RepID=UPI000F8D4766|nr:hypothetical protein [Pseudoflavitalea rhizosphaerae]